MRKHRILTSGVVIGLAVATISCGSDDKDSTASTVTTASSSSAGATSAPSSSAAESTSAPSSSAGATSAPTSSTAAAGNLDPQPLKERVSLKFGLSGTNDVFLAGHLASYFKEFEKENLDVKIQTVPPSEMTVLLAQGQVDVIGNSMSASHLNLVATGVNVKFVFPFSTPNLNGTTRGLWVSNKVVGGDGFQTSDLIGKRIGTSTGATYNPNGYTFENVFKKEKPDVTVKDFVFERLDSASLAASILNGAIDAVNTSPPYADEIAKSGCCTLVPGSYPPFQLGFWTFGPKLLEDPAMEQVGLAFLRAIARTQATYLQGNYYQDPKVSAAIAEIQKAPLEVVQARVNENWPNKCFVMDAEPNMKFQDWYFLNDALSFKDALTEDKVFDQRWAKELSIGC